MNQRILTIFAALMLMLSMLTVTATAADAGSAPNHLIHTPELINVKEPSETNPGYSGDLVCSECGKLLVSGAEIPLAGNPSDSDTPQQSEHTIHSLELINTVEPTYLYAGYTGDIVCAECGELLRSVEKIQPTGMSSYLQDNPFTDVKPLNYYYKPVLWAYYGGITTGTSEDTFSPQDPCTRAQVVTFLWRTMGSPEPNVTESSFTDILEDAYYYKAVLWAVENGITNGTSATAFSPDKTCTRGEIVTFLWRSQGSEKAENDKTAFPDVPVGRYYSDAVAWAVEEEITEGYTDGTFRPDRTCTRAEIVTFLYRAFTE